MRPYRLMVMTLAASLSLVCIAAAAPRLPRSVETVMASGDYLTRVRAAASVAGRAARVASDAGAQIEVDRALATIAWLLPPREEIIFDGHGVDVDNRELLDMIESARALSQGRKRQRLMLDLADRLAAIDAAAFRPGAIDGNRDVLRAVTAESGGGRPDLIAQMSERVATWLRKTFGNRLSLSPRMGAGSVPEPPQWLWILAALLIISVTFVLLLRMLSRRTRVVRLSPSGVDFERGNDLPAADPHADALAQARSGNRREAVRLLFKSLQYRLNEERVVRYRRAQTNFEYLDSVRESAGSLETLVRSMIGTFERTNYGLKDCAPEEFDAYNRSYESVIQESERLGGT